MSSERVTRGALTVVALTILAMNSTSAQGQTAANGIVTVASASSFDSTLARLERSITAKGLTIAAKVDHAAAAKRASLTLRPTTLVIAGNPAAGTPLMVADQTMGVELPLRFLVWQSEDGKAHVSYDSIKSIASRHKVSGRDEVLMKITDAIDAIVKDATKR